MDDMELIRALNRAKCEFQLRTVMTAMGLKAFEIAERDGLIQPFKPSEPELPEAPK